jgi:hypothetical protein
VVPSSTRTRNSLAPTRSVPTCAEQRLAATTSAQRVPSSARPDIATSVSGQARAPRESILSTTGSSLLKEEKREKKSGISGLPFWNSGKKHHSGGVWASKNRHKKIRSDDGAFSRISLVWRKRLHAARACGLSCLQKSMYNTCIVGYLCYTPINIPQLARALHAHDFTHQHITCKHTGQVSVKQPNRETTCVPILYISNDRFLQGWMVSCHSIYRRKSRMQTHVYNPGLNLSKRLEVTSCIVQQQSVNLTISSNREVADNSRTQLSRSSALLGGPRFRQREPARSRPSNYYRQRGTKVV